MDAKLSPPAPKPAPVVENDAEQLDNATIASILRTEDGQGENDAAEKLSEEFDAELVASLDSAAGSNPAAAIPDLAPGEVKTFERSVLHDAAHTMGKAAAEVCDTRVGRIAQAVVPPVAAACSAAEAAGHLSDAKDMDIMGMDGAAKEHMIKAGGAVAGVIISNPILRGVAETGTSLVGGDSEPASGTKMEIPSVQDLAVAAGSRVAGVIARRQFGEEAGNFVKASVREGADAVLSEQKSPPKIDPAPAPQSAPRPLSPGFMSTLMGGGNAESKKLNAPSPYRRP